MIILFFRTLVYLGTFVSGVGAMILTPVSLVGVLNYGLTVAWGLITVLASIPAAYGSWTDKYRFEMTSLPFVATGICIYMVTVAWMLPGTPTRLAQLGALAALLCAAITRFFLLRAQAIRLRQERLNELALAYDGE